MKLLEEGRSRLERLRKEVDILQQGPQMIAQDSSKHFRGCSEVAGNGGTTSFRAQRWRGPRECAPEEGQDLLGAWQQVVGLVVGPGRKMVPGGQHVCQVEPIVVQRRMEQTWRLLWVRSWRALLHAFLQVLFSD